MDEIIILIDREEGGNRLDTILAKRLDRTRNYIQQLIEEGHVTADGIKLKKNYKPTDGEKLIVRLPQDKNVTVEAQDIPLDIMFEDDSVLIINKPKGMVVHPACGNRDKTLVNALMMHCGGQLSRVNGITRSGIVHRLDKDTSGLLVVAKTDFAHKAIAKQLKEHSVIREYHAIVIGSLKQNLGKIDMPIGRHKINRKKMCVTEHNSKHAVTHYKVLEHLAGYTYVSCRLETGRTHQIRVHMSSLGHPLVGDKVYGARDKLNIIGQCLHSKRIAFKHPVTDEEICLDSDLPIYFQDILNKLRLLSV